MASFTVELENLSESELESLDNFALDAGEVSYAAYSEIVAERQRREDAKIKSFRVTGEFVVYVDAKNERDAVNAFKSEFIEKLGHHDVAYTVEVRATGMG